VISTAKRGRRLVPLAGVDLVVRSGITMRTTGSLISIRRTHIARGFAGLLVVLTLTPFTAPFATIDAAELLTEAGHSSLGAVAKPAKDLATAALPPAPLFVGILLPLAHQTLPDNPTRLQRLRTIVLRL
jgi:hypothetical protein